MKDLTPKIAFNIPYYTGKEIRYIQDVFERKYVAGNGFYSKKVHDFFKRKWGLKNVLLTTSGTDALEMAALLLDIKPGDEIILPSYTFVSTALAFVRQGAVPKFVDSMPDHPNMDVQAIEPLITEKTKAIVVVHYAGMAVDMDTVMGLARKNNLPVVEDAAQAIHSFYKDKPLGSIGDLGIFSFHETKNIHCGEGGLLIINNRDWVERAEIVWEKGTNRSKFFKGEVNKYEWVDLGSSFLPDEMNAAFLWAQLEEVDNIHRKRMNIWNRYYEGLKDWADENGVILPRIPEYATHNAHIFYMILPEHIHRDQFIAYLKENGIHAVFHYLALHRSPFGQAYANLREPFPNTIKYTNRLVRLPLHLYLSKNEINYIIEKIKRFG